MWNYGDYEKRGEIEMNFNANEIKTEIIEWIQKFFKENGRGCKAVVGISGGKDSTIVAEFHGNLPKVIDVYCLKYQRTEYAKD